MNFIIIILIIIIILGALLIIYFSGNNKLKDYKERMIKAEEIIEDSLIKKQKIIININTAIKKVTNKKDYLKDYINTDELIISSIEKDLKLDEAVKLINDLNNDFSDLGKDSEYNKNIKALNEVDETLTAAKNLFNQNALKSNSLLKNIPYNLIGKIGKYKIRSYYNNNNKTDDGEF